MTIEFRQPRPEEEAPLRALFTEAFGEEGLTDLFFRTGYAPARCLGAFDGALLAALPWFDCSLEGRKAAYIYGIAAFESCRGRGVGSALIRAALEELKKRGYEAVFLVPAETSLFGYYERFGFRAVSTIREFPVSASTPLPMKKLTAEEYAAARRKLLPKSSLLQEGPCLALLSGYAEFYATDRAVAAVSGDMVWELLGEISDAPGLIAALGLPTATVRTPGPGRPFAMGLGTDGPMYLGLALD